MNLLADLMRKPELRERFNRDLMGVVAEYGVDTAPAGQLEALLTMDAPTIAAKLQSLFQQAAMRPGEFPPPGPDFFSEDGGIDPMYPSPRPGVFRVRPRQVSAAVVNAKPVHAFEFVVYGQSFVNVELKLKRVHPVVGAYARLSVPHLFGTFRGSMLRTIVSPPQGEPNFTAGNKYQVIVLNQPGTGSEEDVGPGTQYLLEIT
jgi:hypothetical protein